MSFFAQTGSPWNRTWADGIIDGTPSLIWASSHLGQVWNFFVVTALDVNAHRAMRLTSYLLGILYLAACAILASTLERRGQVPFFLVASVSPITVFLHGAEEVGFYPAPVLMLALALHRRWPVLEGGRRIAVFALPGIAAALHGVGLFFLPGVVLLDVLERVRVGTAGVGGALRDATVRGLGVTLTFFGPAGALFIAYVVLFRHVSIFPGDAGGGSQGGVIMLPFQSFPARTIAGVDYRAYAFFSPEHLLDVLATAAMGAPAFCLLLGLLPLLHRPVWAVVRRELGRWSLALAGLLYALIAYTGAGLTATIFLLVPVLSLLQVMSLVAFFSVDTRPWTRSLPLLLLPTLTATAFVWSRQAAGVL